jgi:sirohydrochlorin cobaltochelatase
MEVFMKKALVVVSFGTSFQEILEENIVPVENASKNAFGEHDFYRAFTSRFIVKKLQKNGVNVMIEKDMIEALVAAGYEEILVQPTHLIPGFEYEEKILPLEALSPEVKVGLPLLISMSDYENVGAVLNERYGLDTLKSPFVFMGHGTEHKANEQYVELGKYLKSHYPLVYVAGVEGDCEFGDVLGQLKADAAQEINLAPLMLVAGDHAKNDMAGDDEDSWKSMAESAGINVKCHMVGLGALEGIQKLIVEKAKALL